ncbi:DUF2635 domain-containing protein [Vibrio diazotrophicus]|uniref:DUF2635 domain-containing protein n=2 Tax=Vibrio diazotrophicus TaxID=685 RepID=A0ABX4W8X1_VIBDI|nr:DUF2635 domain-containing protein [Vibrio diazotrophicus]
MIKIKPLNGLIVRDPETRKPLKEEGEEKPRNPYWLRRIKDKSVELVSNNMTKTTKKTVATKEAD